MKSSPPNTEIKHYVVLRQNKPLGLNLSFFSSHASFLQHCEDHFFSNYEFWDRVMPRELLCRSRKNLNAHNVTSQELYAAVVDAADEAIRFSLDKPLYVWADQEEEDGNTRESCFYISSSGFVVIADRACVRTLFFPACGAKTPSRHRLFENAWKDTRRKLHMSRYVDGKCGVTIYNKAREWVSPEHWERCPNPHPGTRNSVRCRRQPWRIIVRNYLGTLDHE